MNHNSKIYVAGHRGLVGSALIRSLREKGFQNIIFRTHDELDLTNQAAVFDFSKYEKPEYVFLAAAKVGGTHANNTYPAEFIHQSWMSGVKRLFFLGSSCIYPRECSQPMKEESLLTGLLETTNRPYAVAKIAGIETCWAYNRQYGTRYLAVMPTNLCGPGDSYDLVNSHVFPALIYKMHEAKVKKEEKMVAWGTGNPRREFLYSEDMADACIYLMSLPKNEFDRMIQEETVPLVNIDCGQDVTIRELVGLVQEVVGFKWSVEWDASKPDGTPRKLLDISTITSLGWSPSTDLSSGVALAYRDFQDHVQ